MMRIERARERGGIAAASFSSPAVPRPPHSRISFPVRRNAPQYAPSAAVAAGFVGSARTTLAEDGCPPNEAAATVAEKVPEPITHWRGFDELAGRRIV